MSTFFNLNDYIKALDRYENTPFKIVDGLGYFFIKGEWHQEKDCKGHHTMPTFSVAAKNNPDKTNISQSVIIRKSK